MEKIEGIDLKVEVQKAKDEALEDKRLEVQERLDGLLTKIDSHKNALALYQKWAADAEKNIADTEARLKKIEDGDWSELGKDDTSEKYSWSPPSVFGSSLIYLN